MSAAAQDERICRERFSRFPWTIKVWSDRHRPLILGQGQPHWYRQALEIHLHSKAAYQDFVKMNAWGLVQRFLRGEIDVEGNYYLLASIKAYVPVRLSLLQVLGHFLQNHLFQTIDRAQLSVKSHYDISQSLLEKYLDVRYMAYSCAMFKDVELSEQCLQDLRRPGQGQVDDYDSLEQAQWRKYKDAVDFISPQSGESLLDVGCGYGGQLQVALENHPFGKVVGWTHSSNQVTYGSRWLDTFSDRQWELNEGDYRQDDRVYDHITSTGMISHVGPRGLKPYIRNIRRRIHTGGRYVHHALMAHYNPVPLDRQVGIAFNKRYVWPGFHWFTLGEHIRLLERNGFKVLKVQNLRDQYSKTITAWYERFMANRELMQLEMGDQTFRAWRLYLGGGAGPLSGDVNRIYCVAV